MVNSEVPSPSLSRDVHLRRVRDGLNIANLRERFHLTLVSSLDVSAPLI